MQQLKKVIQSLENFFKQFPHIPESWQEFVVKVSPWVCLIVGIIALVLVPIVVIGGSIGSILTLNLGGLLDTIVTVGIFLTFGILSLMAFGPLRQRKEKGWTFLFMIESISTLFLLLSILSGDYSDLAWNVLSTFIGFYLLFEVKHKYSA